MQESLQKLLDKALVRLQMAEASLHKDKKYNSEQEKLRMLAEMIKEQITHEDSNTSAR